MVTAGPEIGPAHATRDRQTRSLLVIPSLFCVVLYWHGLKAWFQMDDFAWLGLHRLVHDFDSFDQHSCSGPWRREQCAL